MSVLWCLGFGLGVAALSFAGGTTFIAAITTDPAVRQSAEGMLPFAALAPLVAALPFALDGVYVGATWTRAMRNLMLAALTAYLAALLASQAGGLGNAGLWLAFLLFLAARGVGQALAYPALARRTFR